jgi:hypothetical protein
MGLSTGELTAAVEGHATCPREIMVLDALLLD